MLKNFKTNRFDALSFSINGEKGAVMGSPKAPFLKNCLDFRFWFVLVPLKRSITRSPPEIF